MFADIGFPNPEREQLMAHLILQICRIINSRRCEIAMNSGIFLSAQLQGDLRVKRLAGRVHEKCRFAHYSDCRWQRVVALVLQVVSRHRLDHRGGACPGRQRGFVPGWNDQELDRRRADSHRQWHCVGAP